MTYDLSIDIDWLAGKLAPLFDGKPVALQLLTSRAQIALRNPIVTVTPGILLGWPKEQMIVAVVNCGSCIIHLYSRRELALAKRRGQELKPRVAGLVRAGIPAKLAVVLMTTLQNLMRFTKEKKHGNSTTSTSTTPGRSSGTGTRSTRPARPRRYTPYREG